MINGCFDIKQAVTYHGCLFPDFLYRASVSQRFQGHSDSKTLGVFSGFRGQFHFRPASDKHVKVIFHAEMLQDTDHQVFWLAGSNGKAQAVICNSGGVKTGLTNLRKSFADRSENLREIFMKASSRQCESRCSFFSFS